MARLAKRLAIDLRSVVLILLAAAFCSFLVFNHVELSNLSYTLKVAIVLVTDPKPLTEFNLVLSSTDLETLVHALNNMLTCSVHV